MCDKHAPSEFAPKDCAPQSSRRRRLWELPHTCHCPLIGVGLSMQGLRRLAEKVVGEQLEHDDYELHVGVVNECMGRKTLSEALQKEFERRYAAEVARFHKARTTAEVQALWNAAVAAGNVAGAFWAGLTHARCTPELEERMTRDIHMVQHQAGAGARVDMDKYQALLAENARLGRELLRLQERCNGLVRDKAADAREHEAALMGLRAVAIGKDTEIGQARAELAALRASIPELETRRRLANRLAQVEAREQALRLQLAAARAEQAAPAPALPIEAPPRADPAETPVQPVRLVNRSILCVGGRSGNVPIYRSLVERVGAQFAHHDGGLEDSSGLLDASLAAADLVICQTGCISHGAYWRVKDHCKRTGTRCVFVDNPSASSLARTLQEVEAVV
ncbi:DUF2325 domain-containing protein [Massilia sp. Leaf139]|uniref:DUF2325 domain-containing protein n=1 Tax=Massilia sp. Leaf139 TaxID=1736272 RepID=UPI0006FCCBA5|nr:DUF2325 domain-containing protein [Massilia sp. Leaf139]KQQ88085.1 hypothetical protein ASF77_15370 [Massilia sp. Leaf139]